MPYREKYITRERYLGEYKGHGNMYIGFVIGYGYCDTTAFAIQPPHMNGYSPSCGRLYGNDSHYVTGRQQIEDTSIEAIKLSMRGLFVNGEVIITIKSGMTLSQLAALFDVTVTELAGWNNIGDPNEITVGQKIKIINNKKALSIKSGGKPNSEDNYVRDIVAGILTTEEAYSTLLHNHTTYQTTKGVTKDIYKKNRSVRSVRAQSYANASRGLKFIGNLGGIVTTGISYYDIGTGSREPIVYADAGVGTMGIIASGTSYFCGVQIPVVGKAVTIYGVARITWDVFYNLGANYGPSKWYGDDDTKWFK